MLIHWLLLIGREVVVNVIRTTRFKFLYKHFKVKSMSKSWLLFDPHSTYLVNISHFSCLLKIYVSLISAVGIQSLYNLSEKVYWTGRIKITSWKVWKHAKNYACKIQYLTMRVNVKVNKENASHGIKVQDTIIMIWLLNTSIDSVLCIFFLPLHIYIYKIYLTVAWLCFHF